MPTKAYEQVFLTYNPRHKVTVSEFKKIQKIISKHSSYWMMCIEHHNEDNQHLHAYIRWNKPKQRQSYQPMFCNPNILEMCLKQPKEEWKNGLKIIPLDNTEHYKQYYIGYCIKEEGENYPLHRMLDKNETQIQTTIDDTQYLQDCYQYYLESKDEITNQKNKPQANIRKDIFYQTVIDKIKDVNNSLELGKPNSFRLAIKELVIEDKRLIIGFPKYQIRESYMFYLAQYCDDSRSLDNWLVHKLHTGEEHFDQSIPKPHFDSPYN